MVRLVDSLALFPPALTVGAEKLLQLVVVVNTRESLMVLMAQSDCAAFPFTDWPAAAGVDVVALRVRTAADEAAIICRV